MMNRLVFSASSGRVRLLSRPSSAATWRKPAQQRIKLFSTAENISDNNNDNSNSLSSIRTSILKSSLAEVHHHGWTDDALAAGTASVKKRHQQLSMSVVGMMTVDDLIAFCMDQWNVQLENDLETAKERRTLKQEQKKQQPTSIEEEGEEDPLEQGIKTRLEYLIPYLQSQRWHEGMALGVRGPSNALQTQRQLQEMIEIIVASADSGHLGTPQKMALGAVYVATELHLLTDTSPQYQDTWAFLSSRMEDWRLLTGGTSSSTNSGSASDALFVASSVASSLAGGLASLLMNPSQVTKLASMGLPYAVWSSLFQNPKASWETNKANISTAHKDGTHPSDYEVPKGSQ